MASDTEQAKAHRARQALRSPVALGGIRVLPGNPNRHMRRAAQSTKGQRAEAQRRSAEAELLAITHPAKKEGT